MFVWSGRWHAAPLIRGLAAFSASVVIGLMSARSGVKYDVAMDTMLCLLGCLVRRIR